MMYEDLALLSLVIEAGSFAKASSISEMTKSRLSRRIGEMEERLGMRLIDRNSRRFEPTPIGLELARYGAAIRHECDVALQVAQDALQEPRGRLRIASPSAFMTLAVGNFAIEFAERNPHVSLTVDATDGMRMPSDDGYDIVLLITRNNLPDSEAIARRLIDIEYELVASPKWIARYGAATTVADLSNRSAIGWWNEGNQPQWTLETSNNGLVEIPVSPSLTTNNMLIARHAAVKGLGMARLPCRLTHVLKQAGRLQVVLPGCKPKDVTVYALYRNKCSLLAAGRIFLEELALHLKSWVETQDGVENLAEVGQLQNVAVQIEW